MNPTADRVRARTAREVLRRIDDPMIERLQAAVAADPAAIAGRIDALDREWDTDRVIETEAATVGLAGMALGALVHPRWLLLPAAAAAGVLFHALGGRYPWIAPCRGAHRPRDRARTVRPEGPARRLLGGPLVNLAAHLPQTALRVERHTARDVNDAIRQRTDASVARLADTTLDETDLRLREIDAEWDVEWVLQANAATIVLASLALGTQVDRRFLVLPVAVFGFFLQHALQGWCPPIPVIRRLGVRTRREIERERHALKLLRGDYEVLPRPGEAAPAERVRAALAAVDA